MSPSSSLYALVHSSFHEAFGQPHNLAGGGEQWTLQPAREFGSPIHVLLNGTPQRPGVWVFDPHDADTGVENTLITQSRQISEIISLIQARLDFANHPRT